jgi:hypothetical protein
MMGMRAEIRGQRSGMREKPFLRMKQHRAGQFAVFGFENGQFPVPGDREAAAVAREIETGVCFRILTIAVGPFGNENSSCPDAR